jgi:4-amino-4-deoxy-L-arabinose transferase-like glycosyltransferase
MFDAHATSSESTTPVYRAVTLALLVAFLGIRLAGLINDPLLEDHDSAGYLYTIGVFAEFQPDGLDSLTPDLLPLYPLTSAALTHVGLPAEAAARLVSLTASVLTVVLVVMLAVRLGSWPAAAFAAMFVAFEPTMARLSYAVLTEPLYTALVTLGLWLMVRRSRSSPTVPDAVALGVVFGLAFLDRVEGILFLVAIPGLQWCLGLVSHHNNYRGQLRPLMTWTAVFGATFIVIAAPQVRFVSKEMNQFALNGRQAWTIILSARNGQSEEQRLQGLDYSPTMTNLRHLQRTPADLANLDATVPLKARVDRITGNLDILQRQSLPQLFGLPLLVFVPVGLLFLLRTGQGAAAFILAGFAILAFVGPVMHNTVPRHILASAPPLILLAALGALGTGRELARLADASRWRGWPVPALLLGLTVVIVSFNARPLWKMATSPDKTNPSADPYSDRALYARFLPMLKTACASNPNEKLLVRKRYIATLSGCERLMMPYATLEQLLRYAAGNGATLMFVESQWDSKRPFYRDLVDAAKADADLELLARDELPDGRRQFLYRLHLQLPGSEAPGRDDDRDAP